MPRPCPSCGEPCGDAGAVACPHCGASLEAAAPAHTLAEFDVPEGPARRVRKFSSLLLTVLAAAGVFLAPAVLMTPLFPTAFRAVLGAAIAFAVLACAASLYDRSNAALARARSIGMKFLVTVGAISIAILAAVIGVVLILLVECSNALQSPH